MRVILLSVDMRVILQGFVCAAFVCACVAEPRIETRTGDMTLNVTYARFIDDVIEENEDIPTECQHIEFDTCWQTNSTDGWWGYFIWQNTTIGERRLVQYPYSLDIRESVFGSRDDEDISSCPGRPLTEFLIKTQSEGIIRDDVQKESGACSMLKCRMLEMTMHFKLYVHRLSLIELFLIGIFVKVAPVIVKKCVVGESAGKWSQLLGCAFMLVLLGTPWIFSQLRAIDSDQDSQFRLFEGIMAAVFTLTLNLLGIFIFIFHCIPEMRKQWWTFFYSVTSSMTSRLIDDARSVESSHTASTKI